MLSCACTPIESCIPCETGSVCSSGSGLCEPPNWSMYDLDTCEHNLFESTLCEITDIQGFPFEYRILLPKHDYLFGEDPNNTLSYPSVSKCIYAPEMETTILEVFGLTADDTLQYMSIPKSIFTRDLSMVFTDTMGPSAFVKPRMGDVITTIWNNRSYEIASIEEEQDIFLAKKFTWSLVLRPYRFSEQSDEHREVHTGFADDPFESIITGGYEPPESGEVPDLVQRTYLEEKFGDNENVEDESDTIVDYPDPDERAFGR